MDKRPKIKIELTNIDKAFEIIGWLVLFVTCFLTITNYNNLPDIIPIHYNAAGEADGFGRKANILILPIISTILFIGLTLLNRVPHIFNYPTNITRENAKRQYTFATRLIRYLKVIIVVMFGFIAIRTIQSANRQVEGLETWFLPLSLGSIFILIVYTIVKLIREK